METDKKRKVRIPEKHLGSKTPMEKLPTVDMSSAQGRLDWAGLIVYGKLPQYHGLDDCKPQTIPSQPTILYGISARDFFDTLYKKNKDAIDNETIVAWQRWVKDVRRAEGQNRLILWSLFRCLQIYKENEEKKGSTESMQIVGKFIRDMWKISNPHELYQTDIHALSYKICIGEGLKELPNNWRAPSEYYKKQ